MDPAGRSTVRHLMGAGLLAAAGWFLWSAQNRRRQAEEASRAGMQPPPLHPSLVLMADLGPSIIVFGLVVAGGQVALAFWLTRGGGVFSLFDLAGFVALLAAYGAWVKARTKYRVFSPGGGTGTRAADIHRPLNTSPGSSPGNRQPRRPAGG